MTTIRTGFRVATSNVARNFLVRRGRSHCENFKLQFPKCYTSIQASSQCACSFQKRQDLNRRRVFTSSPLQIAKESTLSEERIPGAMIRLLSMMGFTGKMRYNRFKMRFSGLRMYKSCADNIDIQTFIRVCNLPDTFFSWFLITQLHVWMCMVRLRNEGKEGNYIIHYLVLAMWQDVQQRAKVLGANSVHMKQTLPKLTDIFQGILFAYDEGLMSNDKVLAAALWRNIFSKKCDDPQSLETMVEYVRKQLQYLDNMDPMYILSNGTVDWLPLTGGVPAKPDIRADPATIDSLKIPVGQS